MDCRIAGVDAPPVTVTPNLPVKLQWILTSPVPSDQPQGPARCERTRARRASTLHQRHRFSGLKVGVVGKLITSPLFFSSVIVTVPSSSIPRSIPLSSLRGQNIPCGFSHVLPLHLSIPTLGAKPSVRLHRLWPEVFSAFQE